MFTESNISSQTITQRFTAPGEIQQRVFESGTDMALRYRQRGKRGWNSLSGALGFGHASRPIATVSSSGPHVIWRVIRRTR
jgi:hypothetical protein